MNENRISFLLNHLVREMNSQANGLLWDKFEITYSQFVFLATVGENKDIDVTRLAQTMGVTKGAVSKRLSWFVERKFVTTHQTEGDAKRVLIAVTKKGAKLVGSAGHYLEKEFLAAISKSPGFDQAILQTELSKMLLLLNSKRKR